MRRGLTIFFHLWWETSLFYWAGSGSATTIILCGECRSWTWTSHLCWASSIVKSAISIAAAKADAYPIIFRLFLAEKNFKIDGIFCTKAAYLASFSFFSLRFAAPLSSVRFSMLLGCRQWHSVDSFHWSSNLTYVITTYVNMCFTCKQFHSHTFSKSHLDIWERGLAFNRDPCKT